MKVLYTDEHLACFNYGKRKDLIEIVDKKEDVFEFEAENNCIAIVYKGSVLFSSGMINGKEMKEGDIFVIPFLNKNIIEVKDTCRLFIFKLDVNFSFCDHFSFEKLHSFLNVKKESINPLKANSSIGNYLVGMEHYINEGLDCLYFSELKIKELLFILRVYYSEEALAQLFYPILTKDAEFSNLVYKNIKNIRTAKELAATMNYSFSGFNKRFKKVFGISANKWMEERIAREIYREINCTNKTMMEIAYQYGFSPSYFNDFCRRIFNATPKQIRKSEK